MFLYLNTSTNKYYITVNDTTIYKMIGEFSRSSGRTVDTVITDDYPVTIPVFGPHLI